MDELLLCPECLGLLEKPAKLSCPHRLCVKCCQQIQTIASLSHKHDPALFFCPICGILTFLNPQLSSRENNYTFEIDKELDLAVGLFQRKVAEGDIEYKERKRTGKWKEWESSESRNNQEYRKEESPRSREMVSECVSESESIESGEYPVEESFEGKSVREEGGIGCSLCDKEGSHECLNCNISLCSICRELHIQNPRLNAHQLISYKGMAQTNSPKLFRRGVTPHLHLAPIERNLKSTCNLHLDSPLLFYSYTTRMFYCQKCIKESELDHEDQTPTDLLNVSIAINNMQANSNFEFIHLMSAKINNIITSVKTQRSMMFNRKKECELAIIGAFKEVHRLLDERQEYLLTQLKDVALGYEEYMESLIDKYKIISQKSSFILEQPESLNSILQIRLLERASTFLNTVRDLNLPKVEELDLFFEYEGERITKEINEFGMVCNSKSRLQVDISGEYIHKVLKNSNILPIESQTRDIFRIFPSFSASQLIFTLSQNGASNKIFHKLCDNQGPLLILVKTQDQHIFGAYSGESWRSLGGWRKSGESFLFSLPNKESALESARAQNIPIKFGVKDEESKRFHAMYFSEKYGAIFGNQDLVLNLDNLRSSYSKLGSTYEEGIGGKYQLAGRYNNWNIQEIEIFSLSIPPKVNKSSDGRSPGSATKRRSPRSNIGFESQRRIGVKITKAPNPCTSDKNTFSYNSGSPSFRGSTRSQYS